MNIIEWTVELRLAVALALGFLVGLERESAKSDSHNLVFGGVRTHPLISLFGFACAWLHQAGVSSMLPIGLLAMAAITGVAYVGKIRMERFGSTSEISALLTFVTGALALMVDIWAAMALGVFNTLLLSEKARLESYVESLSKVEFLATLKFLLVTLIILPVLPNKDYTRFQLNPTRIWEMVILVSTIGFVGYLLSKKFGRKDGLRLSGLLGGMVSSTALTIAVARMAAKEPGKSRAALQSALLGASVMYVRILVLVAILAPALVPALWWKLLLLTCIGIGLAFSVRSEEQPEEDGDMPTMENPFELTPSLLFAAMFVVLSMITWAVRTTAGESGLLTLSAVVGVTDIDPFILSLIQDPSKLAPVVAPAMLIAMMSNTIVKGFYFGSFVPGARKAAALRYVGWAILHIPLVINF